MDLLTSGADEDRGRWAPPVALVAVLGLLVALAGVAAAVRLSPGDVVLEVTAQRATVAVRGTAREAVLDLTLTNAGRRPVDVRGAELDVPGVLLQRVQPPAAVQPQRAGRLRLVLLVTDCADLAPPGRLRVRAAPEDGEERVVALPVDRDAVVGGCAPVRSPTTVAVAARTVAQQAAGADGTARGTVDVEVANLGAPVGLVALSAEVGGVLFVAQTQRGGGQQLASGQRTRVPLEFVAPFCPAVDRGGRVVLTVEDASGSLREVGWVVSAVREARVPHEVHLDALFAACRRS